MPPDKTASAKAELEGGATWTGFEQARHDETIGLRFRVKVLGFCNFKPRQEEKRVGIAETERFRNGKDKGARFLVWGTCFGVFGIENRCRGVAAMILGRPGSIPRTNFSLTNWCYKLSSLDCKIYPVL